MELFEFLKQYLEYVTSRDEERGQKIFDTKKAGIKILEKTSDYISLAIPSEKNNRTYYNVDFYTEDNYLNYDCDCPAFDNYDDCKHCVAAALFLLEEVCPAPVMNSNRTNGDDANFAASKEIIIPFTSISYPQLSMLSRKFYKINNYSNDYRSRLLKTEGTTLLFHYIESVKKEFDQVITFIPPRLLKVECTCGNAKKNDFCIHLMAALSNLRIKYGDFYFNQFIDYTHDKNILLNPYHLTVEDEEAKDFQFGFNSNGDIAITKTPSY
ncbi:MAG TPA: SWIM zinc finger family protein, partial [Hanamia sp.]|nr:SWIM zinc finger family protein [Hanamia sp.]